MEIYVLKSAACLVIFYSFYKLFLERENMHTFKRFYLLGTLGAAIIIPLLTFTRYIKASEGVMSLLNSESVMMVSSEIETTNYVSILLWSLYGLGVLYFSLKFVLNLFHIIQKIRKNPLYKKQNLIHVLLNGPTTPHTFFSYIFLNKRKFEADEIPEEVLLHEQAHANEKHSLDILVIEFLQILLWFNPFIYFIKHSIKLNHEFLADRAVLNKGVETSSYQNILLAFSSNANPPQLAHSINYSSIKKRFTVMKTHTSKRGVWLRSLLLLPLLAGLIYGFSTTNVVEKENSSTPEKITNQLEPNANFEEKALKKIITLEVGSKKIILNGKKTSLTNFTKALDKITHDWTKQDYADYLVDIVIKKSGDDSFLEKVESEYRKTQLYKKGGHKKLIPPPPPAPYGVKVVDKINGNIPPPPSPDAPVAVVATPAPMVIVGVNDMDANMPPPPPKPNETKVIVDVAPVVTKVKVVTDVKIAPPPPPEDPMKHIKKMADKGATFYYEDKEVTYNYVIDLVLFNKNLNIQTKTFKSSPPVVYISKNFVFVKGDN